MSELLATPPDAATDVAAPTPSPTAAPYSLVGSYSTVQVLSPTLINPVVYCTIQTHPSGVIAAMPVSEAVFNGGPSGFVLSEFAKAIEQVMSDPRVTAGVGSQSIDDSGLLTDSVLFTVEYTDPVLAPNGATAQATVPVKMLATPDPNKGGMPVPDAITIIDGVYANLKAAAGG
jgi:hypothetical protein